MNVYFDHGLEMAGECSVTCIAKYYVRFKLYNSLRSAVFEPAFGKKKEKEKKNQKVVTEMNRDKY